MSIIERTNPLNLQYKICVVTNASSPLGVVICKTLLKANALVLGIDTRPRDHSLNAGLGTHFQFEQVDIKEPETPKKIIEASQEKFESLGGKFDALVNLVEKEDDDDDDDDVAGIANLTKAIGNVMRESRQGSIITVAPGSVEEGGIQSKGQMIDFAKSLMQQFQDNSNSIRTNIIIPEATTAPSETQQSTLAYQEAQTHMTALIKTEEKSAIQSQQTTTTTSTIPAEFYKIANLVLFLSGGMSENLSGKIFGLDGSCREL